MTTNNCAVLIFKKRLNEMRRIPIMNLFYLKVKIKILLGEMKKEKQKKTLSNTIEE